MNSGKSGSQTGHAFLDSFLSASPELQAEYRCERHGTKIVLSAPDEEALQSIFYLAQAGGLPSALIVDSGHVMPPHFDGSDIVTAVGIGPATREQVEAITGGLKLLE